MSVISSRPLALVTGASSGIGFALARQLAEHGYDLIVAAEDPEITTAAGRVRALGARVDVVQGDLATQDGIDELTRRVRTEAKALEVAVLNAGVGSGGAFVGESDLARELAVIDLNVRSTVQIAKALVPDMVSRGSGRILITAAASQPASASYSAVYIAGASFLQAFASALGEELSASGVSITALLAGSTPTPFFARAGAVDPLADAPAEHTAEDVARDGIAALLRGEDRVSSPAPRSRAQELVSRALPEGFRARLASLGTDTDDSPPGDG